MLERHWAGRQSDARRPHGPHDHQCLVINPCFYDKVPYDPYTDFEAVTGKLLGRELIEEVVAQGGLPVLAAPPR
jgi:hypothetical protein